MTSARSAERNLLDDLPTLEAELRWRERQQEAARIRELEQLETETARRESERLAEMGRRRLTDFIKAAWPIVEPGRSKRPIAKSRSRQRSSPLTSLRGIVNWRGSVPVPRETMMDTDNPRSDDRLTDEQKARVLEGAKRDIEAAAPYRPQREPRTPEEEVLSRLD